MTKVDVDGLILEARCYPIDYVANNRRKITPQRLSITSASCIKRLFDNLTRKTNNHLLTKVN